MGWNGSAAPFSAALRTASFAALYVVATVAGRLTVMEGSAQSLVWPSAGVAVVWFAAQRRESRRWPDALALTAISLAGSLVTGNSMAVAMSSAAANLVQTWVFLAILGRLCPEMWGAGGDKRLEQVRQLWRLLVAAAGAALCGTAGPIVAGLLTAHWPIVDIAGWTARNTASIILIGTVGLRLCPVAATSGGRVAALRAHATAALLGLSRRQAAERLAVVVASVATYVTAFPAAHGLPLAFPLLTVTVWAALRCGTTFVVLHTLVFGSAAILFTLHGDGPFAAIESSGARALVAQIFVGVMATVGLALALGRDERDTLIRRLADAEDAASSQARLLTTIVDSMSDGLAVVDSQGRFILRNPAVRRLLGGAAASSVAAPEQCGFYHPDGTSLRHDELAHVRALAGDEVRGVDLLVRNAGVPGGRMLRISATALPDIDGGRVVMVCHDVTIERRHRDELAAFAGVVAHDLLAPLAVVEAWAETLADAVRNSPDNTELAALGSSVARIERAAARMGSFIRELLAHATARDAPMSLRPVSLEDLVRDITAIRGEVPAGSATAPAPRFHLGELVEVRADPALLRQVLENLIGNAIKYTAPGDVPDITVSSAVARPGWIRVEVADRGIGVPSEQRLAVFQDFHRAHVEGGFSGSGLGLAISRRIVERHGGTIGVDDVPGGGSVFYFTLPMAPRPASRAAAGQHSS